MGRMGFNVPTPVEWLLLLSLQIAKEGRGGCHSQTFPDYPLRRFSAVLAKNQAPLQEKGHGKRVICGWARNLQGIVATAQQRSR